MFIFLSMKSKHPWGQISRIQMLTTAISQGSIAGPAAPTPLGVILYNKGKEFKTVLI